MRKTYRVLCLFCAVCDNEKKVGVCLFDMGSVHMGVVEYKCGVYTFDMFTCECGKRFSICRGGGRSCWFMRMRCCLRC